MDTHWLQDADQLERLSAAQDRATPPDVLAGLTSDRDVSVRKRVGINPSTPPEVLSELASDADEEVHVWVAENPSTPPEVLATLATREDTTWSGAIRTEVAGNPSTSAEVLAVLARDHRDGVRRNVAKNPAAPDRALDRLRGDWDPDTRAAAHERLRAARR